MFSCADLPSEKADKIEGMASWLILGGVLALAAIIVIHRRAQLDYDFFSTPERIAYFWAIAMGVLSLRVKRGGVAWRGIVALGAAGFLCTAGMNLMQEELAGVIWPVAVLWVLYEQYSYDMKIYRQKLGRMELSK